MKNDSRIEGFINRGWFVFPLQPGSKFPYKDFAWKEESSDSLTDVQQWEAAYPGCNWGLDCGKSGITVIDLDIKKGINGLKHFTDLIESDFDTHLYETMQVETPSGGMHLYYNGLSKNSAGKIANGVDTRSEGGYVLLPGSKINGDIYRFMHYKKNILLLPEKLKELIGEKREKNLERISAIELDQPNNTADAVTYLQSAPPSLEGAGGDENAYRVACRVRDCGISEVTTLDLMLRFWNEKCQPPWTFEELQKKVNNAYQYAESTIGSKTAEGVFAPVKVPNLFEDDRPKKLSAYEGQPADRDWVIQDWLPTGEISSLYGDGGVGKSLLALQLGMAVASGGSFCGIKVSKSMPVLAVMAEDSDDELHRRLHAIRGIPEYAFEDNEIPFFLWSRAGRDAVIANVAINDAKITITEFGTKLDLQLAEMGEGEKLLILDTLADIFVGDENNRQVVNRFVKVVLGGIAKKHNATILMLAHPSKTSTADGTYYSGSTAWNNAVRNRLVLKPHECEDLKDMRKLERVKSNYAITGETITLQWERGAFKVVSNDSEIADEIQNAEEQIIFNAIRDQANAGKPLSVKTNANHPIVYCGLKNTKGREFKYNELKRIVSRLQNGGQVTNVGGQRFGNGLWPVDIMKKHADLGFFKPLPPKQKPEKEDFSWL